MTPKEKAQDLYDRYNSFWTLNDSEVKECALIVVDEIKEVVRDLAHEEIVGIHMIYWSKVKQEIEKL